MESFWGKKPSSFGHLGEVGQETAYGIAGTGSGYSSVSKKSSEVSNADEKEDEDLDDKKEEDDGGEEPSLEPEDKEK